MVNEETSSSDISAGQEQEPTPDWSKLSPVQGLEHLGAAIVDANGIPSGSPANYETTRGQTGEPPLPNPSDVIAAINTEFTSPPAAPEQPSAPINE